MQDNHIGFSHPYTKLFGQTSGLLLQVVPIDRNEIHEDAIDYDTEWYDSELNQFFFPLDPGKYLRLTFIGDKGIPFTTYRTDTPEHRSRFFGHENQVFAFNFKTQDVVHHD